MAIIGYKRVGLSKDKKKIKWELLIQFDTEDERTAFEKIVNGVQEVQDAAVEGVLRGIHNREFIAELVE